LTAHFATAGLVGCPATKDYNGKFFRELICWVNTQREKLLWLQIKALHSEYWQFEGSPTRRVGLDWLPRKIEIKVKDRSSLDKPIVMLVVD